MAVGLNAVSLIETAFELLAALGHRDAHRRKLFLVPARPNADDQTLARKDGQRCHLFGKHHGMAKRKDEDGGPESHAFGTGRQKREHLKRIKPGSSIDLGRDQEVFYYPQSIEPEVFSSAGVCAQSMGVFT